MRSRRHARDPGHKRPSRTQEQYLAQLRWNIKDAKEALHNAVGMSDWAGVKKYAAQIQRLEDKLWRAQRHGPRRLARATRAAEGYRARGGLWYKPLGGGRLP